MAEDLLLKVLKVWHRFKSLILRSGKNKKATINTMFIGSNHGIIMQVVVNNVKNKDEK